MTEEEMKDLMIDYIDGHLAGELKEFVAKQIEKNAEHKKQFEELKRTMDLLQYDRELEPDCSMKGAFEELLKQEAGTGVKVRTVKRRWHFSPWQIAASVVLVSGLFITLLVVQNNRNQQQIADLKREMEMTKYLVIQSLEDRSSASRRLQAINTAYDVKNIDKEIINALIRTMNNDDNTNVRLAAVEALVKYADEPDVMSALIVSMEQQTDPLVQITLINLMVQLRQKGAVEELQRIIKDEKTIQTVKDEAHMAVFKLS
ncbi:hypothetical protein C900_05478 [Fulvivirga imtechensis AK7]|uniref:HEAT repeat domain-containing protein n=1 Tax=Fulvivirga imtechensis AK7 TaxID=1237149 RepID=L8JNI0_9BACT|nr:HEAT repeat domain-containing protein [Fulvivirga imtechensis]ELR69089.1 hypothetical protein C900_05478 [Fulvivirga imtechensis AK7]